MSPPLIVASVSTDIMPDKGSALRVTVKFKLPEGFAAPGMKPIFEYEADGTCWAYFVFPREV